jgi:hypothetical protein
VSVAEILSMVVWATEQVRALVFPQSGAAHAAADVVKAIAAIYQAVDDVTFGTATPAAAKAGAQVLIDALASNDAAADAAAEQKP